MSGYEEAFGKTETQEPAAVETPAAVESVAEPAPSAEPAPVQPSEPVLEAAPVAATPAPQSDQAQERDRDLAGLIKALQDEREQKRAAREEAAALKAWRAEQERLARQDAEKIPHPLDDPEGFARWQRNQVLSVRKELSSSFQRELHDTRMSLSRELIEDQIGADKAKDLYAWIDTWGPQSPNHAQASKSGHPYRWAWTKFQEEQRAKRGQEVLSQLGDKSLDELIEERVAARLAASQSAPQPVEASSQPERQRNADGTFASSSQPQQRHQPVSLALVTGAPAPRGGETRSGYDAAFRK